MKFKVEQINSDENGAKFFKFTVEHAIEWGSVNGHLLTRDAKEYHRR